MPLQPERSIKDLLESIAHNVQDIIKSEIRLAKTELVEDARATARATMAIGAGAMLAHWALGFVFLALVFAFWGTVEPWVAALMVALFAGAGGFALISLGISRLKKLRPGPEKMLQNVKETVVWLKKQRT